MNQATEKTLALIDAVEAIAYQDGLSSKHQQAIGESSPSDVAVLAGNLVASMQLAFEAVVSTGTEVDSEWAIGYAFRSARAAVLGDPAPRLLP